MERDKLDKCLRQIGPTLADKTPIEQLKYFWFDADRNLAWTYNEVVGTEVPFAGDLRCGVGSVLAGIIENSSAENVDLKIDGNELHFKAGGSKGKISIRGFDEAIYPFPSDDAERSAVVQLTGDAEAALRYVNKNAADSGVTLVAEGDELSFYSRTNKSISWARIPLPDGYNAPRLLLSPQFCQRLQNALDSSGAILEILDNSVIATFESSMRLFGRITAEENPRPFRQAIESAIPEDAYIEAPVNIHGAVKRIRVLCPPPGTPAKVHTTLAAGDVRFEFKSTYGELNEHFAVKGNKRKVDAYFDPELMHAGFEMEAPTKIAISESAFAMLTAKNFGYIMQASRPD